MDKTKETLADADFFSIMNVLMQLRKVCNHPDLFESRTIESPFIMNHSLLFHCPALIVREMPAFSRDPFAQVRLPDVNNVTSMMQHDQLLDVIPQRSLVEAYVESQ
jgi:SNF2 family DNA or RNA helicase